MDTLRRVFIDTNAYKLQDSLCERVVANVNGCHTALHFGVKAKENQDKVTTFQTRLHNLHKIHIKHDLSLIIVHVRQQNFLNS